jgi:hypothetical protein
MPDIRIPPPPLSTKDQGVWATWYIRVKDAINQLRDSLSWSSINFTGSNLTDIVTRNHNDLKNIQGGITDQRYHLTLDEYNDIWGTGSGGGGNGAHWGGGVDTTKDIIIDSTTSGLVLLDTAGHYWRVMINTSGVLTRTDLGTTKP